MILKIVSPPWDIHVRMTVKNSWFLSSLIISNIFAVEPMVVAQECPSPVTEGSNVTPHCNATGNPPPSITWIWQDTGDVLASGEQLVLTAVNRSQVGSYQCLASNGIGNNSTRTCSLDVLCK